MALDLFAGIPVTDYGAALPWYERFFGAEPAFLPNDIEAVWAVAEHRYIYIVQQPERAGNALVLSFVDDLDDRVAGIASRGIEPAVRETYDNGVTKVTYRDADGEFEYQGTTDAGDPSALPAVFVMRVRDGEIVSSRDYHDHLASARAAGRLGDLFAALSAQDAAPADESKP